MRLSGDASPGDIIQGLALGHAGFDVAFKNNKSPLILSFPRKRESIWPMKVNMDSRLRGNDNWERGLLDLRPNES